MMFTLFHCKIVAYYIVVQYVIPCYGRLHNSILHYLILNCSVPYNSKIKYILQYNTVQCDAMQYNIIPYNATQYCTIRYRAILYYLILNNSMQYHII